MKKKLSYSTIVLSTTLIVALGGCGSTETAGSESSKVEVERLSPFLSHTLTPSEMPSFNESADKSSRAIGSEKSSRAANFSGSMSVDATTFQKNSVATVTLTDMPGQLDWVGLFYKGDVIKRDNLLTYSWTGDFKKSGTVQVKMVNSLKRNHKEAITDGDYMLVAFTNSGAYIKLTETTITVASQDANAFNPQASLDNAQNLSWNKIAVTLSGLAGFAGEWVGIFPKGSSNEWANALEWEWTSDAKNGKLSLLGVPAGEYDLRVFYDEDMELETSASFTVNQLGNANTTISTYQTTFTPDERITVNFSNMPGNIDDWVGIFPVGSDSATTLEWTNGLISGDISLDAVPAGSYELRAFHSGNSNPEHTISITVSADAEVTKKVALFADEHDPDNRLLAVDYGNMELVEEVSVEGSLTHHADVVGDVNTANHILMIPKGSTFINVYTVKDRKFVKKINLPFKPRSADAFNASKNLVLLPSSSRPAAVLIDAKEWKVVGTAGMNVSCELKFNYFNYHPWYYKSIVYKSKPVDNPTCAAPDFGGSQISGHPIWLDDNHFSILDRANRLVHVYKITKTRDGQWDSRLTDVFPTSTSVHQMLPSGKGDNVFYGMTEGNGNNKGVAPVIYKWKFNNGKLTKLNATQLVTTQSKEMMKKVDSYNDHVSYWNQYIESKDYYQYYYPTNFSAANSKYYPGDYSKYQSEYSRRYKSFYNNNVIDYNNYFKKYVPVAQQQIFKSLGGHNLYISPAVNGTEYLWGAVASGQTFVLNTNNMQITNIVKSAQGSGHVDFQQNGDYAVITNHKSRNVTIANYKTQKLVTNINLPYAKENIFAVLQSHSPYITKDDKYFHNTWTDGGVFFRINLDTLKLDSKNVYVGGIPIQGNYFPNYKGD